MGSTTPTAAWTELIYPGATTNTFTAYWCIINPRYLRKASTWSAITLSTRGTPAGTMCICAPKRIWKWWNGSGNSISLTFIRKLTYFQTSKRWNRITKDSLTSTCRECWNGERAPNEVNQEQLWDFQELVSFRFSVRNALILSLHYLEPVQLGACVLFLWWYTFLVVVTLTRLNSISSLVRQFKQFYRCLKIQPEKNECFDCSCNPGREIHLFEKFLWLPCP